MNLDYSELSTIGNAYDISSISLLVLDRDLNIRYANNYAKKLLNWSNSDTWLNKSITNMCKAMELPNLVDAQKTVISYPISIGRFIKEWQLLPVMIDGQASFFLIDKDVTKQEHLRGKYSEEELLHIEGVIKREEETYKIVEAALQKITGQTVSSNLSIQHYIDELCNCFESIIAQMPGYIYWKDANFRYIFCNNAVAYSLGFKHPKDIRGKTDYDFGWNTDVVDKYRLLDEEIIKTGQARIGFEETVVENDGKSLHLIVNKMPLFSKDGTVIGIIGVDVDISDRKEADELKLENEKHKIYAEEQEKFRTIVGQMAHDIRSPLSTLKTFSQNIVNIPEMDRLTLKRVAMNIEDIASHVLNRYKGDNALTENNIRQHVLVAAALAEIASERRYKYQNTSVQFEFVVINPPVNNFVFVQIEPSSLDRMISNLINNAFEALPKTGGKITVTLMSSLQWVEIVVQDNGKGMTPATFENVRQRKAVKSDKKHGSGIGLTQIFDTLEHNLGEFEIYSTNEKPHNGTVVRVRLPKAVTQNWIATEIKIKYNDTIVIIDDDESIHEAWDKKLCDIIETISTIQVKHYRDGREALRFLDNFENKQNVLLLSDYELLGQDLNGLEIMEQSKINRSILVTSHYAESEIRSRANKLGAKILPKDIVYSVPLKIEHSKPKDGELVNAHIVFVDDEIDTVEKLIADHYSHLLIDIYPNPFEFLKEVDKYPKDTKIIIDNNFYNDGKKIVELDGTVIAKQLHGKGYTKLYLYSWENCSVPEYVTFILKTDRDTMARLDKLL